MKLSVFPKMIPAEIDRTLDVFVTVVDSEGNPTKTPDDIPLEFFSSEQYPIGEKLSDFVLSERPVIKKVNLDFYYKKNLVFKIYLKIIS